MTDFHLKEHVSVIRQAFSYIHQFTGETFVIKIDSSIISAPLFPLLVKDIVLLHRMGIRIILVPGTRDRIEDVLKTYSIRCRKSSGVRITSAKAIPFVKMAAFDVSNRLMTLLAECNANGVIGNWVRARALGVKKGVNFQHTGKVDHIQADIVKSVLDEDLIPIMPNIGWNARGKPYNISSDELAFATAVALKAAKLFFISDSGRITDKAFRVPSSTQTSEQGTISQLTVPQAQKLMKQNAGKKSERNFRLIDFAQKGCTNGVDRVHIIDGKTEGTILKEIFSNRGLGTMVYADIHENIRQALPSDIAELQRIIQPLAEKGFLVHRTAEELETGINGFAVYEVDNIIHGCAVLEKFGSVSAEIGALAVDEMYTGTGIGKKLVSFMIKQAKAMKFQKVFVLTTEASDWFYELGFKDAKVSDLPKKKKLAYDKKRNSQILIKSL